jgi:hypothetical protein
MAELLAFPIRSLIVEAALQRLAHAIVKRDNRCLEPALVPLIRFPRRQEGGA